MYFLFSTKLKDAWNFPQAIFNEKKMEPLLYLVIFCTEEGPNAKMWRFWPFWRFLPDKFSFANSSVQL